MIEIDILCLGEPLVEFNRQADGNWVQGFGGDVSNVAIAAARQGARSAMLTQVGRDRFGDALIDLWQSEGVNIDYVKRLDDAQTGIYFVDHDEAGHHFTYYRKGSAASRMTPDSLQPDMFNGVKFLHVSAISQAISASAQETVADAIAMAKEARAQLSYDTNLRLLLWPLETAKPVIADTAAKADILLPGLDDARQLTGLSDAEAIAGHFIARGARLVALTLGRDGSLLASPEETHLVPPFQVGSVDATGAGDVFDGALLARLSAGDDPLPAARYANAAAALSTAGFGAVAPIPDADAVAQFLCESADRNA